MGGSKVYTNYSLITMGVFYLHGKLFDNQRSKRVSSEYKNKPIVPFIACSIASLTGISRVYEDKHWGSDVLIGAVFGYAMGKLVYNKNNWGIHIKPATTPGVTGVTLIFPIP